MRQYDVYEKGQPKYSVNLDKATVKLYGASRRLKTGCPEYVRAMRLVRASFRTMERG